MSIGYIGNIPGSSLTTNFVDQKFASWFSGPAVDGTFVEMRLYPYGVAGNLKKHRGVIYSSVGGSPDTLRGETIVYSTYGLYNSTTFVNLRLQVPYSFVSGEEFYLGIHCAEDGGTRRNLTGTWPPSYYNSDEFDDGPSDPFGTPTSSTLYIRIIAYYSYGPNYEVAKAVGYSLINQIHIGIPKAEGFALIESIGIKVAKAVGFALISEEQEEEEEGVVQPFVVIF